ncbi:MAG: MBL fold metallo-hydrolase [Acidobacteriota bacterium]|nr:MBL fold metallo-hydrolase [Acidobacteriota bacterium]
MFFRQLMDRRLAQYAYLIGCQQTREAIVIDPQRDVDRYLDLARLEDLEITAVTETHIHADFLSGARELAERTGAVAYLSDEGGEGWRYEWPARGDYRHVALRDKDTFSIGRIEFQALHTPGHTPEHVSFLVTDRGGGAAEPMGLASGDFVFVGDLGRPDLLESAAGESGAMEPAARALYRSVGGFLELPDYLRVWPGHGAGSACGKALGAVPDSTVGYERRFNVSIQAAERGEDVFVDAILDGQPEPPLYFGRMKRLNKSGPPMLGELPSPARLTAEELAALAGRRDVAVIDTRLDRKEFMSVHLEGSFYAPLDKSFPTITGSYVEPGLPIYLVIEEPQVEEAVRELVRIGLDEVVGFTPPEALAELARVAGASGAARLSTTRRVGFSAALSSQSEGTLLDVRGRSEFDAGRVEGALNIAHTRLLDRRRDVPKGETVWVYCRSGARAAAAAALLERFGHPVVYVDDLFSRVPRERVVPKA